MFFITVLFVLVRVAWVEAALDPIYIKGAKFFYSNHTRFFFKGIAYQSDVSNSQYKDPLANHLACERDVPILQSLGLNAIRTYSIDPAQNHDLCMSLLDAAGIYVITDLGEPLRAINREQPEWDVALYKRYSAVIDNMAKYNNTIGFFAGNEVIRRGKYTPAAAFVKAAVRDLKAHIVTRGHRPMGVGYATEDDPVLRRHLAAYMDCGHTSVDFWGYNNYEWCGESDYVTSGYAQRTSEFSNYNVPVFFSEYGCNMNGGRSRKFTEIEALYGKQMSKVFSGGIAYEYFQDAKDYGLVATINSTSVIPIPGVFEAFSSQIHAATPTPLMSRDYISHAVPQLCPAMDEDWKVAPSILPPRPDEKLCECMMKTLTCTASTSTITSQSLEQQFATVCGMQGDPCHAISNNATSGVFGPFSMCIPLQQLSYAYNTYFETDKSGYASCTFGGNAHIVKPVVADSTCSSMIAAATAGMAGLPLIQTTTAFEQRKKNDGSLFRKSEWRNSSFVVSYPVLVVISILGASIFL